MPPYRTKTLRDGRPFLDIEMTSFRAVPKPNDESFRAPK
jgi:hypothetical protein